MEQHHSCVNTRAIIEYFQEKAPEELPRLFSGLGPEIEQLPDPLEFLMEINNWVSSDVVIRMFKNAREITGDNEIAFKIGFDSAARKKLGYIQRIILFAYRNPKRTLRQLQKINDKFNRNKIVDLVETTRDRAVVRLHWFQEIPATADFCLFNKGIYTGIPTIWNLPPAILDETKCYFKGDDCCEYHLTWAKRYSLKDTILNLFVPWRALNYTIEELEKDKELLKKKFTEIHVLNIELGEKLAERLRLQAHLQESEARFRNLLEYIPEVAVKGYTIDGTVRYWNKASEQLYGYTAEEAINKNLRDLIIPPDIKQNFDKLLRIGARATRSGEFLPSGEIYHLTKNGNLIPVHVINTVVCLEGSDPLLFCIAVDLRERKRVEEELKNYRDHLEKLVAERTAELTMVNLQLQEEIQERRRTEGALRESEAQFRTVFEGAPVGVGLVSLDWEFIDINLAFMEMLGFSLEELRQVGLENILHPDDLPAATAFFQEMKEGKRDFYQREGRYRRKDGTWMWGQVNVSAIRDESGKLLFAVSMLVDITQEKAAQAEISAYQERLRALASELSLTEERERRLLAADLHDHIGQILALAQIKLGAMRQEASSPEAQAAVTEVRDYIGQAIRYTRSLTYELGLPILYDLGLEAALEWLAEQMNEQHGLEVRVHRDQEAKPLGEAARVLVFRVVRELLTNVVKHAHASKVDITIDKRGSCLHIQVVDDGVGFEMAESGPRTGKSSGYGLFSIRERLTSLGGVVKINSQPGQGTRVAITVPLEQQEAVMN
jgi:PAS domain S-box-containing protein|uniref:Oxygen sensor histidine kinase NreB n=1 Tax=Desulfobacca acetoxidans TaxID=60893 RepID=A0A7V6DNK8_9BACT